MSPSRLFRSVCTVFAAAAVSFFLACGGGEPAIEVPAGEEAPAESAAQGWSVIGPGGGGSMFSPTVNPDDPEHAFVRCDMTGAYVTENGGESWRMFNLRTVVNDFEFDPLNPDRVYAGNKGLYRSEDRGRTWRLIYPKPEEITEERMINDHAAPYFVTGDSLTGFASIDKITVDSKHSEVIRMGWSAMQISRDSLPGIFLGEEVTVLTSRDDGESWKELPGVYGHHVLEIVPGCWWEKPRELLVITDRACVTINEETGMVTDHGLPVDEVVAAGSGISGGAGVIYITTRFEGRDNGGVYRSDDYGRSWERVNSGLVLPGMPEDRLPYFNTLGVCEDHPETVYLSCRFYWDPDAGERNFGILKTTDSGANWSWVYRTNGEKVFGGNYDSAWMVDTYGPGWCGNPHGIGVCPSDPDIVYVTDYGRAALTRDGGASWKQVYTEKVPGGGYASRGLDVTTCYGVHFDPFDSEHMFISYTDIGLMESRDRGRSWSHSLEGVPEPWWNTCYWLEFDPDVEGRLWSVWGNGHDLPRLKMFRRPGFIERYQGGVAVSEDGGGSWSDTGNGIPENTVCTQVLVDPDSPADARTLYVLGTGRGVYKSTDGGRSWELKDKGLGPNRYVWRIERQPSGALWLIVMRALDDNNRIMDGALYRSTDGAESWTRVELPESVTGPNDLAIDPDNPERMYLSCWPRPSDRREYGGGLLRTDDGGKTWKRVFQEDAHVYAAAVSPRDNSTVVINTFDSAAFRSDDRGETWKRLEGYNFKWGHRVVFDPLYPEMVYLTTFGGSVFYGPATGVPGAFEDIENAVYLRW